MNTGDGMEELQAEDQQIAAQAEAESLAPSETGGAGGWLKTHWWILAIGAAAIVGVVLVVKMMQRQGAAPASSSSSSSGSGGSGSGGTSGEITNGDILSQTANYLASQTGTDQTSILDQLASLNPNLEANPGAVWTGGAINTPTGTLSWPETPTGLPFQTNSGGGGGPPVPPWGHGGGGGPVPAVGGTGDKYQWDPTKGQWWDMMAHTWMPSGFTPPPGQNNGGVNAGNTGNPPGTINQGNGQMKRRMLPGMGGQP